MKLDNQLSKDFILRNVSQEDIFSRYTDIPIGIIENCINTNRLTESPFRYDSHPSTGFRYSSKGKLKMKDFGGYFWGDCFDVVCKVLNKNYNIKLDVTVKKDFWFILEEIAKEFNLLEGISTKKVDINVGLFKIKRETTIIDVEFREYGAKADYRYWINKYHNILDFKDLYRDNIYPVERIWINPEDNPEAKYYFTNNDPCYAYYEGKLKGVILYRLYFPARSKDFNTHLPKFISNNQSFQRLHIFNNSTIYDKIIIIKSTKDAVILDKLIKLIDPAYLSFKGLTNIGIIAYPQENYELSLDSFNWLLSKLKSKDSSDLLSFLDFDKIGRKTSITTRENYGIPYVFLTNGYFGLPKWGAKDISDYLEINGINNTLKLIINYIDYVTRDNYFAEMD